MFAELLALGLAVGCQAQNYQPSNNIYGYNTDSNASPSALSLVINPNYRFLNDQLSSEYAQTYQQGFRQFDQQSNGPQYNNGPALSNDEQNRLNFQQIQRDSNSNPTSFNSYSNNIYGYNTGPTSSSSSGGYVNPNTQFFSAPSSTQSPLYYPFGQYQNPNQFNAQFNPNSNTAFRDQSQNLNNNNGVNSNSGIYQSVSDLKTTRLRDQSPGVQPPLVGQGPVYGPSSTRFFDPGNNQTEMYYPYRTTTNFNLPNQQINRNPSNQVFYNPSISSTNSQSTDNRCRLNDPYWCSDYVNIYLASQTRLNSMTQQAACQLLVSSLVDSFNGCCNTVRSAGCRN